MGIISRGEEFSQDNLDNWDVMRVRCYDQPAAETGFVGMRHSFAVLDLEEADKTGISFIQKVQVRC
jgi:hypothetical protein